jgi:hypothetical protein
MAYQSDQDLDGFEEVSVREFKFESVGTTLRGVYLGSKTMDLPDPDKPGGVRQGTRWKVRDGRGLVWGFWGNYHLEESMECASVGQEIIVERIPDIPSKSARMSPTKQYRVRARAMREIVQVPDADIPF